MVSFIILHYKNIEETLFCLENLKKIVDKEEASIIVVDNNTLNDSDKKRILEYTKDIVALDKNYGFAKANNKGIEYAQKKYDPNFYCVINNDVFIYQKDFIQRINQTYKKYKFDMLGPKIDSPSGESVNPFPVLKKRKEIINEIKKCQKLIEIYNSVLLTTILLIYIRVKKIFVKPIVIKNSDKIEEKVALHGCAIIFSKKYIQKYKNGFYEGTFLFHEEEFLYQRVVQDKQISIYDPNLEVFHKEGASLKKKMKSTRKSKLYREKERLNSLKLLLMEMQGANHE